MKEVLLAIGFKVSKRLLELMCHKVWERRQAEKEAAEAEEKRKQEEADAEQRAADACDAARDCANYIPIIVDKTHLQQTTPPPSTEKAIVSKFKPRKGRTKRGKKRRRGN